VGSTCPEAEQEAASVKSWGDSASDCSTFNSACVHCGRHRIRAPPFPGSPREDLEECMFMWSCRPGGIKLVASTPSPACLPSSICRHLVPTSKVAGSCWSCDFLPQSQIYAQISTLLVACSAFSVRHPNSCFPPISSRRSTMSLNCTDLCICKCSHRGSF
jgi:hypothetical protein